MSDFRSIKNRIIGGEVTSQPEDPAAPRQAATGAGIAPSSRRMQRGDDGQPIYSNTPGGPACESDPAFSSPIEPGPDEGKPLRHGPAWAPGLKASTQVSHSPGKNDLGANLRRGKPITY